MRNKRSPSSRHGRRPCGRVLAAVIGVLVAGLAGASPPTVPALGLDTDQTVPSTTAPGPDGPEPSWQFASVPSPGIISPHKVDAPSAM